MKIITLKTINNKFIIRALMLAVIFMLFTPFNAKALTVHEVEAGLLCVSCPGEALNKCRSGCGDHMRKEIKGMISRGMTKEEIFEYYSSRHGANILTTPPKSGFNLVAYIAPFVGLLIGVVVAFLLVKKWGHTAETVTEGAEGAEALSSEMQQKIDDELSKLEEDE
jgi:cytochrome c-type biogenesis protein CcmH